MPISRRDLLTMMASSAASAPLLGLGNSTVAGAASLQAATPAPLSVFSRHLNWASMEEAVDVAAAAGFGAIAWTLRPGSHIVPERVAQDLPKAVELTRKAGLATTHIITTVGDAQAPYAQAILETAAGLGIRYYRAPTENANYTSDVATQLDALRRRIATLVPLNERYGMTALIHTHDWPHGSAVWDSWLMVRDFDPAHVGINFDTAYGLAATGTSWREAVRFARKHIRFLSLKDFRWKPQGINGLPGLEPEICRPGDGIVDYREVLRYFFQAGFNGPLEIQYEYPVTVPGVAGPISMTGYDYGKVPLQMPKAKFIELLRRDVDFYKAQVKVGIS